MAVAASARPVLAAPRETVASRAQREMILHRRQSLYVHRRPVIVHCSHHQSGTAWMFNVLRSVAHRQGLRVFEPHGGPAVPVDCHTDVALYEGRSAIDRVGFGRRAVRGSHMIRDPRDVAVASYYYQLRGAEAWNQIPLERFGGRTYHEVLQSLTTRDGLLMEIRRLGLFAFPAMADWDYDQGDFYELRYEDLWGDEPAGFRSLFRFYGFSPATVEDCVQVAVRLSTRGATGLGRGPRVSSGRPGEWREHLALVHLDAIDEVATGLVARLGYPVY